jgi:hypothetical protein
VGDGVRNERRNCQSDASTQRHDASPCGHLSMDAREVIKVPGDQRRNAKDTGPYRYFARSYFQRDTAAREISPLPLSGVILRIDAEAKDRRSSGMRPGGS